jgi:hypothetical protein
MSDSGTTHTPIALAAKPALRLATLALKRRICPCL